MRKNQAIVTDSAEGPECVRVSAPGGAERIVRADDPEGIREAIDELSGPYEEDDTQ